MMYLCYCASKKKEKKKRKKSSYHMGDDLHIRAYFVHFHKHLKDNRLVLFRFQNWFTILLVWAYLYLCLQD